MSEVAEADPPALNPAVQGVLGGRRGIVDGALPTLVFVAVNALAGLVAGEATALACAVAAAAGTAVVLVGLRLLRKETLKQAVRGLVGLGIAIAFAVWSGDARDFFLPGIYVDAAYGTVYAGSALLGRPLVGYVYALLFRVSPTWRDDRRARRVFVMATFGWSGVYMMRAAVQGFFYQGNRPEYLAVSKLPLGRPLTAAAVALTLAAARRAGVNRCRPLDRQAR